MSKNNSASKNSNLSKAKNAKNDEFYTQFHDIEKEMQAYLDYDPDVFRDKTILLPCDDPEWSNFTRYFAQNFELLGLKKLISTSFAPIHKHLKNYQPSLFETENERFDADKSIQNGKIFVLTQDSNHDGVVNVDDLQWEYLDGDGDFRSEEVKALRDEADIIITNPPFSLFREFLAWIVEADKLFAIIGNKNSITYKEVFPFIQQNKIWSGAMSMGMDILFSIPNENAEEIKIHKNLGSAYRIVNGEIMARASGMWFTNLDHGRRHQPLELMSMEENQRFNKRLEGKNAYVQYDNYDAIEVPFTNAIPSDYFGVMGVPISFLDKYNPEQFEILGATESEGKGFSNGIWDNSYKITQPLINGGKVYKRIFIRHKTPQSN